MTNAILKNNRNVNLIFINQFVFFLSHTHNLKSNETDFLANNSFFYEMPDFFTTLQKCLHNVISNNLNVINDKKI